MSSNDLINYSIMLKGSSACTLPLMPLPVPIRPVSHHGHRLGAFDDFVGAKIPIQLPPLMPSRLTEKALGSVPGVDGPSLAPAKCPSMSSMSSASSSVSFATSSVSSMSSPASSPNISSAKMVAAGETAEQAERRRQRLGPSCDNCRARKVKCDAQVTVMARDVSSVDLSGFVSGDKVEELLQKQTVSVDESTNVVISNNKLIKFKFCNSCATKSLPCSFTKGFTKEDIVLNNKKKMAGPNSLKYRVGKGKSSQGTFSSRKSSCMGCRKRKIKCEFNTELNKCEGCSKKNHECVFEVA
ncbi:Piso0_005567 [Millerozyma farinosa CBS 7064]|uniref:Piso0_005567 protein n=1 Tax=Pichia sorbitophila (strain ATCC MYA-4447 / BCRC 22081 / CBS 7064 / NBRC 10061 / NRRL Y-12695) TaxID=559304 RepID=G8Y2B6_PICSO|nr:Piso0_005567 [Millerozyma farinosa CBS 7064]